MTFWIIWKSWHSLCWKNYRFFHPITFVWASILWSSIWRILFLWINARFIVAIQMLKYSSAVELNGMHRSFLGINFQQWSSWRGRINSIKPKQNPHHYLINKPILYHLTPSFDEHHHQRHQVSQQDTYIWSQCNESTSYTTATVCLICMASRKSFFAIIISFDSSIEAQ